MRKLLYLLILIPSKTFLSCTHTKSTSNYEASKIDVKAVDFIEISNSPDLNNTVHVDQNTMNDEQKNKFVNKWNNAISVGPIKSAAKYFITIHFKDSSKRQLIGSGQYLKEGNDFAFDIGDSNYIDSLWKEINIDHM